MSSHEEGSAAKRSKKLLPKSKLTELEEARKYDVTLFDGLHQAIQWVQTETKRKALPDLQDQSNPTNGPPESSSDQVILVQVTMANVYNFTSITQDDTITNPRNIAQIVKAKCLSNDAKIEKIVGTKFVGGTKAVVELAVWRMLGDATSIHRDGYEVPPWESVGTHTKPERFPTFAARWAAMVKGLRENKILVRSLIRDPAFSKRFILRPAAELKGKNTNATLNEEKAKYIKKGRDVDTPEEAVEGEGEGEEAVAEGPAQKKTRS